MKASSSFEFFMWKIVSLSLLFLPKSRIWVSSSPPIPFAFHGCIIQPPQTSPWQCKCHRNTFTASVILLISFSRSTLSQSLLVWPSPGWVAHDIACNADELGFSFLYVPEIFPLVFRSLDSMFPEPLYLDSLVIILPAVYEVPGNGLMHFLI